MCVCWCFINYDVARKLFFLSFKFRWSKYIYTHTLLTHTCTYIHFSDLPSSDNKKAHAKESKFMCVCVRVWESALFIFFLFCLPSPHLYSAPFASCVIAFAVVFFGSIQKCVIQVPGSCSTSRSLSLLLSFSYAIYLLILLSTHLLRVARKCARVYVMRGLCGNSVCTFFAFSVFFSFFVFVLIFLIAAALTWYRHTHTRTHTCIASVSPGKVH